MTDIVPITVWTLPACVQCHQTMREALDKGQITEDEYFIEYGKSVEQIRILDALMNSDLDTTIKTEVRKIIRGEA